MNLAGLDIRTEGSLPRIVIVGGGFAGLAAARELAGAPASIVLVDRTNFHLFQPLLYQVATSVLSPADIASPIRSILRDQDNVHVALAEAVRVKPQSRLLCVTGGEIAYDYLLLAAGATHSYFGHAEWATRAPGLKTIEDALELRRRVLLAYEEAEWEADEAARQAKLTFVVIGGGPTGVELAGALKEIAAHAVPRDFRFIDTTTARVILVEAGRRLLSGMPEKSGEEARRQLERMGVEVRLRQRVSDIRPGEILLQDEPLAAANVIWAAGVRGVPLARTLGAPLDERGRVKVEADLHVPGYPEIFVVGDLAHAADPQTGEAVPGVAPAAIQMGRHAARIIRAELEGGATPQSRPSFSYHDKGTMAAIGRNRAVAAVGGLHASGILAWLAWSLLHIWTLIGFRKRVFVFFSWLWSYFSYSPKARLITGSSGDPAPPADPARPEES